MIITEDSEKKLISFLKDIENDAFYWRGVLCIQNDVELVNSDFFKNKLSKYFLEKELRVFFLKNNNFIVLVKGAGKEDLLNFRSDMITLDKECKLYIYDLSAEWMDFIKISKKIYLNYIAEIKIIQEKQEDFETLKHNIDFEMPEEDSLLYLGLRENRKGTHILLVDDEPMTLRMISNVLSDYTVHTATDSQDALNDYMAYAPDVVFLDINMPISSGHEVLKKITSFDDNSFVVMLSANSYPEDIKKAMSNGAKGFVSKPFSKSKLLQYIQNFQNNALPIKRIISSS